MGSAGNEFENISGYGALVIRLYDPTGRITVDNPLGVVTVAAATLAKVDRSSREPLVLDYVAVGRVSSRSASSYSIPFSVHEDTFVRALNVGPFIVSESPGTMMYN